MDQPSDENQQPHRDRQPLASGGGQQPQDEPPEKDVGSESTEGTEAKSTAEKPEEPQEAHFRIGLREVVAGVIVGAIVLVVGILVVHGNGSGSRPGEEEPPKLPTPPTAIQAKDAQVPDATGPVEEQVWAQGGAQTFSEPFKQLGGGLDIPHNENVLVSCKLYWPHPESVEKDGYWYRIVTRPWTGLFSPANSYWNGDKPGQPLTHSTDFHVRDCREGELPDG